jgi:hypothetical protein
MGRRAKIAPQKFCERCRVPMARKRFSGRLEDFGVFLRRRFCTTHCSALGMRKLKASLAALRKRYRLLRGTICELCKTSSNLGVHHKNNDPSDNTTTNLMTLCGSCHTRWHWQHGKRTKRRFGDGLLAPEKSRRRGSRRERSPNRRASNPAASDHIQHTPPASERSETPSSPRSPKKSDDCS